MEDPEDDIESPLLRLASERVVEFSVSQDGKSCTALELCDMYFEASFNKSQMLRLSDEIRDLAGKMTD